MRWLFLIAGLCAAWIAPPPAVCSIAVIIEADSTGPVIGTPRDYVARHGASTRLDSVITVFTALTKNLPTLRHLIQSDDLLVILALEDHWDPNMPLFTNIEPDAPRCPRLLILGSYLLNQKRTPCLRTATIAHEAQHAADFVAGLMPPVTSDMTIATPDQAFDILEVETRGFMVQMTMMKNGHCQKEDEYGRVFRQGGLPALRELIARTYALDRVPNMSQRLLKHYIRWTPPSTLTNLAP